MIVPAAAIGALGYGYMWWKVFFPVSILLFTSIFSPLQESEASDIEAIGFHLLVCIFTG